MRRALLAVDAATQIKLANMIVATPVVGAEAEKLVAGAGGGAAAKNRAPREKPRDIVRLEEELSDALATQVAIKVSARNKGQLVIDFAESRCTGWRNCETCVVNHSHQQII